MSIFFDTRIDPAAKVQAAVNYRNTVFDDARCVGAWSVFHDTILHQVGGVSRVESLKTIGVPLVQANTARRPDTYEDPDLLRTVLYFDTGVSKVLTATGLVWRPDQAFSIVAVVNSLLGSNVGDLHVVAGDAALPEVVGLTTINAPTQYQTYSGRTNSPPGIAVGRRGWNRIISSCTAAQEPRAQANWGRVGAGASGTSNGVAASRTLNVGHPDLRFGGYLADLLVFNVDLQADDQVDYLAQVNNYLNEVNGNFV